MTGRQMIRQVSIQGFKSVYDARIQLGRVNCFIGANGVGKSNLLEALGVLGAAANGTVDDESLLRRGVRAGLPRLYKSSFMSDRTPAHIAIGVKTQIMAEYRVSLLNPLESPEPAWSYKTEFLGDGQEHIVSDGVRSRKNLNPRAGLAALQIVDLEPANPAAQLMQRLQEFAIYSPNTPTLRGIVQDQQSRTPVGLNGGQDSDGVLRRQVLAVSSPAPCQNGYALNWWLASRYLQDEGITLVPHDTYLQLGTVPFKRIRPNMGGYRRLDTSGHQILINYQATEQIAEQLTLSHVLSDQFDPSQVRERIVLIGVVAPSFNDHDWFTPYSSGQNSRRMTGVEIQAHMTSQIISAVLDGRPLLWTWSEPIAWIWIGGWTVVASVVAVRLRSRHRLGLVLGLLMVTLAGSCWVFISYGGWIPLVPAVLGIVGGGIAVNGYRSAIAAGMVNTKGQRLIQSQRS